MANPLVMLLICIIVFAVAAYALLWVCDNFFKEFPPARWICGAVLLIVLILAITGQFGSTPFHFPHP